MSNGKRICPNCRTCEPVGNGEIWPSAWGCASCGRRFESKIIDVSTFAPQIDDSTYGYDPTFFELTAAVESNHFWFVPRRRLLVELIARYFPSSRKYLELGCGTGSMVSAIAASKYWQEVYASDVHTAALEKARGHSESGIRFVQLDARSIPAASAFDVIGAFDVIEHIEDDRAVLASMYAATTRSGGIVIAVPQHPFLWSHSDEIGHHVRRYRRGELESKVRDAGFSVVFSNSYSALLLPLMLTSRFLQSTRRTTDSAAGSEYSLPAALNRTLTLVMQFEVSLALWGLPWLAGGSRVVVAKKN